MQYECHRFYRLDATSRELHFYIEDTDECLYMGEYTAWEDYNFSPMNNLMKNFKKKRSASPKELEYKQEAIEIVAEILSRGVPATPCFNDALFVPVPPSKTKDDENYDDRLLKVLSLASIDFRELVSRKISREAQHTKEEKRPRPEDHVKEYEIITSALTPNTKRICIFDDVLTTGSTFKAMQLILKQHLPDAYVFGFFIARRIFNS